jgi:hypothetical protein
LKPARPGESTREPANPGLELGRVEEKTGEEKTRCDPARPNCKPVDFFFLLKRYHFDFFLKK